jgi:hypothetical protein
MTALTKHKKGCSIRDANDFDTVCRLKRDNRSVTGGGHIYAGEKEVTIGTGRGTNFKSVTMSKKQFNVLIDWYNKEQKFVRK